MANLLGDKNGNGSSGKYLQLFFVSSASASNRNAEWEVRQTSLQCGVRILVLSVTLRNAIYSGVRV